MTLSALSCSLLRAHRGPFLSPDTDGGGGASAATDTTGASGDAAAAAAAVATDDASDTATVVETTTITRDGKSYVLQTHAEKLIGDARREGKTAAEKDAKRRADETAAKEKGDFEKLATERQKRIEELEADAARRDRVDLQRAVAAKYQLDADLATRLVGDTEAELDDDAKKLAKLVGNRKAPDTEAGAGAKGSAGLSHQPIVKTTGDKVPAMTFDGKPKVAWSSRP